MDTIRAEQCSAFNENIWEGWGRGLSRDWIGLGPNRTDADAVVYGNGKIAKNTLGFNFLVLNDL